MASKLGPHVITSTPAALEWARSASIVKAVDNLAPLLAAYDSTIRVWRHYLVNQNTNDPDGTAQAIIASLAGYHHHYLFVELWNETHPSAASLARAVTLLHAAGYKVAGASWGTGDYTQADWDIATVAGVDAYSVHCYWDPGKQDIWEAYRYRQFWKIGQQPVLIAECGRRLGWTPLNELQEYAAEISKDGYVLGATPFTCGPWQYPGVDPQAFNVDALVPQLMQGGTVPNVGQGFTKCIPLIGQFVQDQVYHFPNSPQEIGLAVAEFGHATWVKATNETWAHCNDGRAWRDYGNHSKNGGAMVAVSGPF